MGLGFSSWVYFAMFCLFWLFAFFFGKLVPCLLFFVDLLRAVLFCLLFCCLLFFWGGGSLSFVLLLLLVFSGGGGLDVEGCRRRNQRVQRVLGFVSGVTSEALCVCVRACVGK